MNKLQASMRDRSAKTWRERKVMYKVGSPMKGCNFCGDVEVSESGRVCYTSGFQVFRSHRPWETKWTWRCDECGSVDLACWAPDALGLTENQLGKEPLLGNREFVAARKKELRKQAQSLVEKPPKETTQQSSRIAELEARLEELKQSLRK